MCSALLTFADGSTLTLKENQRLIPIVSSMDNTPLPHLEVSKSSSFELWVHIHDGLIPGLCEFLVNCSFFHLLEDSNTIYKSDAVIKIQNL